MNGEIREGSVSKGEASGGKEEERLEKTMKNGGRQFSEKKKDNIWVRNSELLSHLGLEGSFPSWE